MTPHELPDTIHPGNLTRHDALRYACDLWSLAVEAGWRFARFCDEYPASNGFSTHERMMFYEDIAAQTNLTVKRIQNIVSLARNPAAQLANDLGLDISYGESIAGLPVEQAEHYLARVADGSITSVQQLRREVWAANTTTPVLHPPVHTVRQSPLTVTIYPHDTPASAAARMQQTISRDFLDALAEALLASNKQTRVAELEADRDSWRRVAETRVALIRSREIERLRARVAELEALLDSMTAQIHAVHAERDATIIEIIKGRDARNAELEAKATIADTVPWHDLHMLLGIAAPHTNFGNPHWNKLSRFLEAHAPKGDAPQTSVPSAIDVAPT